MNDYDYYACPPEIADQIENWRRWATGRTKPYGRCMSIESRYKSPDVFEPAQAMVSIDILAAAEVERIIRNLPDKNRAAIKAHHIMRWPTHIMRRRLRDRNIGELMRNSWEMIKNLLDKRERVYNIRIITAEPSIDETWLPFGG